MEEMVVAVPDAKIWPVEPHTLAKHQILKRYLQRWMPIIGNSFGRMMYFDGFSGPGIYSGGEPGSPIVAVQVAQTLKQPFPDVRLVFSEERLDRKQELESQLRRTGVPSCCTVDAIHSTFEAAAERLLSIYTEATQPPTFTLVDPFGFSGIPFRIVQALMSRRSSECLITFMVESMNRWIKEELVQQHIIDVFGTDKVLTIADEPGGDRVKALLKLYLEQLSGIAKFCRYFEMRNCDNRVLYYLFFISNNSLGFVKMKEAMWEVDKTGCFQFSDATNPDQEILFTVEHTWLPVLKNQIEDEFQERKRVNIDAIKSFVDEKTMFIDKHMKAAMRILEDESRISPYPVKTDGKPRKKKSFPDGVIVDFL